MRNHPNTKKILILAGPNGAGKTTFARNFLPAEAQTHRFINADLIAAGLAPFDPDSANIKAARLMLQEIDLCAQSGESFAFETTLSGRAYIQRIKSWQRTGYQIKLWFLSLPSAELAISRVTERVLQGGHAIPDDVIRRRFDAGLKNFHLIYGPLVDSWALFDNSERPPRLLDWRSK